MACSVGVFFFLEDWVKVAILLQLVAHFIKNIYSRMFFYQSCFYKNIAVDSLLIFFSGLVQGMRERHIITKKNTATKVRVVFVKTKWKYGYFS